MSLLPFTVPATPKETAMACLQPLLEESTGSGPHDSGDWDFSSFLVPDNPMSSSAISAPLTISSSSDGSEFWPTPMVPSASTGLEASPLLPDGSSPLFGALAPLSSFPLMDLCGPSPASWTDTFKAYALAEAQATYSKNPDEGELSNETTSMKDLLGPLTEADPLPVSGSNDVAVEPSMNQQYPYIPTLPTPSSDKKRVYSGTRNTKIPPISLDAPAQPKSYIAPSATSRKVLPAKHAKRLAASLIADEPGAKRGRGRPRKVAVDFESPQVAASLLNETSEDMNSSSLPSVLPLELRDQIEKDRKRNREAARESRARKAATLSQLQKRVGELEQELARDKEKIRGLEAEVERFKLEHESQAVSYFTTF